MLQSCSVGLSKKMGVFQLIALLKNFKRAECSLVRTFLSRFKWIVQITLCLLLSFYDMRII